MQLQISTISEIVSSWTKRASAVPYRYQELFHQTINEFQEFGQEYEEYFENIIQRASFDPEKTTEDRLRYQYFQTLQGYWNSLEQVVLQWQVEHYAALLEQAYDRSMSYITTLKLPLPGILVYFNRVTNIRYLPFTKVPILGIPYLFSGPKRWSAMAHEMGHYLFWNLGTNLDETPSLQEQLKSDAKQFLSNAGIAEKQQRFVMPWLEEIFSDVVGARTDGLDFIESSEEFTKLQAGNKAETTFNDGHHPPLILRPFVWRRALQVGGLIMERPGLDRPVDLDARIKFPISLMTAEEMGHHGLMEHEDNVETMTAEELLPAVEILVDFLSTKLDEILTDIQPKERTVTAFQELKGFLETQQTTEKGKGREVYELLLTPRVLEGGYEHTHGLPSLHGWHEARPHFH